MIYGLTHLADQVRDPHRARLPAILSSPRLSLPAHHKFEQCQLPESRKCSERISIGLAQSKVPYLSHEEAVRLFLSSPWLLTSRAILALVTAPASQRSSPPPTPISPRNGCPTGSGTQLCTRSRTGNGPKVTSSSCEPFGADSTPNETVRVRDRP
jgi:hypothetical protein